MSRNHKKLSEAGIDMQTEQTHRIHHPFSPFVPEDCHSLLLGSFPGKASTRSVVLQPEDWYYGAPRNQFWPIMRMLFPDRDLSTKAAKMTLFVDSAIAVSDIILSCIRSENSNMDSNLTKRAYNTAIIRRILKENPIRTIFFTGKGVQQEFVRHFHFDHAIKLITLPSPSPAYCKMSIREKAEAYRANLL